MNSIAVKYTGPWGDYSGMGQANRNAITALDRAGVSIKTDRTIHVKANTDHGPSFLRCQRLTHNDDLDYLVKIIHTTPDLFLSQLEPLKYHIAHFFWETDKVCNEWAWYLNLVNEVWTGSEVGKKALIDSGVRAPIFVFPQAINTKAAKVEPLEGFKKGYLFYSIFEWIERKNPKALLRAYWEEFKDEPDVTLLLKTYYQNFSQTGHDFIKKQIKEWKEEMDQRTFPKVMLILDLLSQEDLLQLHATGDCFVSAHRGEGWGIPQAQAMVFKNPVISTGYGGIHEWASDKEMFLVDWKKVPVFNMSSSYYKPDQNWAEIDVGGLREKMRFVYENKRRKKHSVAEQGNYFVKTTFSYKKVGEMMKARLEDIYNQLLG